MTTSEYRVVIADDEPAARRGVRQLLAGYDTFSVVAECRDGRETLRALESVEPHVLFLDIQMPEIDGFEVLERTKAAGHVEVIFLTAFDQFAIKAFEHEALDYLVKPVSQSRFAATMTRLRRRLESSAVRDTAIFVPSKKGGIRIPLEEIDWIESADNYARIWSNGRSHLVRQSLDELEARVSRQGFARAHRKALVRIGAIHLVQAGLNGDLVAVLRNGTRVAVSRRRRAIFRATVSGR